MSHQLDNMNGTCFYADSRTDAWHQLGQQIGHAMTPVEAMESAHLAGWNVRKTPIVIPQEPVLTDTGVTMVPPLMVPNKFATVRDNPVTDAEEYLGIVGSKYEPVQNEASADLLQAITDESGAFIETAGALYGGRQTFVTMKLPQTMTITDRNGREDKTEWYLSALNSHDGSTAWRALLTPVRIVCANTQSWAISEAKSSFSIQHTRNAKANIAEAHRILGISYKSIGVIDEEFQRLADIPLPVDEAKSVIETLVKTEDAESKVSATKRGNVAGQILKLFVSSPSIVGTAAQGSRFGLYNAVTEYADHYAPVRGADDDRIARALRTVREAESSTSLKARAFALLRG